VVSTAKDIEFGRVEGACPRRLGSKTMGGRASGPGPLIKMLDNVKKSSSNTRANSCVISTCLDIGNFHR